ncbi:penicillin-binding protein A [Rhizocola hellebori]|uniref:Penicillin-binding protein A n=1 Tax=Rhizocola hellebori TaxID=1392758 RepID=A0A8J3QA29_9ACTN|nr:penicillin-binding transpeptidase domain-containing protein [Rhizocola hellebori]GIH05886.1 penicillin-binding protein A [Rhizocola hellebori]
MNAPLRKVGVVIMVLFGLLFANLNWVQAYKADEYRSSPYNGRVKLAEYKRQRGVIMMAGGTQLAISTATDDDLKYLRSYPLKEQYAHIIGYKPVNIGSTGVEYTENDFLAGESDKLFGDRFRDLFTGEQTAGGNVLLTISPTAQERAFNELTKNKVGAKRGAVVALDPATGAVKALVSMPSFDPNVLVNHDTEAAQAAYKALLEDPEKPLLNRAISEINEPGSVMKVLMSAAALEEGRQPATEVTGGATYQAPGTTHKIPNSTGVVCPESITLIRALTVSCNTAFARLGVELGSKKIVDVATRFGFYDQNLSVGRLGDRGVPVAQSVLGQLVTGSGGDDQPTIALSSIGQASVSMTPLEGAMIAAAVANGGQQMQPHLVQQLVGPDLTTNFYVADPKPLRRSCSPSVATQLQQMMTSVVEDGTGTRAKIEGYQVGGKTGTAEGGEGEETHGWFVGFALKDGQPVAAVAVFLENAGKGGSSEAARIAGQVMRGVIADKTGK